MREHAFKLDEKVHKGSTVEPKKYHFEIMHKAHKLEVSILKTASLSKDFMLHYCPSHYNTTFPKQEMLIKHHFPKSNSS